MRANEFITEAVKQRLDPKCWKGYKKQGTKMKGGVRVNNCVKEGVVEDADEFEVRLDGQTVPGPYHDFDHARNKASKLISYQKGEVAEVYVNGKLKMRLKLNTPHQHFDEAGSAAQQAAIAVDMKKQHKKPKNEDVYTEEELNLLFDSLEEMFESMGIHEDNYDAFTDENILSEAAAWQKKSGKNKNGGLNKKGVASYRRENPGSKLQTAVTTKPSKLKKGSKAAKRRKSFCARMKGMKKSRTGAKTKRDPNSRINKSLRKWNC